MDAIIAGIGTDFIVQVEYDAIVTMQNTFSIYGSVTLINNGTWIWDSNDEMYWDSVAYWVNLGLLVVVNYANDWIRGSSFPGLTTVTSVGTLVNMGTLQFNNSGGFYYYDQTGNFYQCSTGIIKLGYTLTTQPGQIRLAGLYLDGYIGCSFSPDFSEIALPYTVLTWKPTDPTAIPSGDITILASGLSALLDLNFCFSKTGTGTLYQRSAQPLCPNDAYQVLDPFTGGACSSLPDKIKNLVPSCPASADCGIDTGKPFGSPSTANVNAASLAFFVSLICLLLKF